MPVKSAMRQAGRIHHLCNADCVEALGAEQLARRLEDGLPVLGLLLATDLHFTSPAFQLTKHDGCHQ